MSVSSSALRWRALFLVVLIGATIGYLADLVFNRGEPWFLFRMASVALVTGLAFRLLAVWPARLPTWAARWALQVVGVACAVPVATLLIWSAPAWGTGAPFWANTDRLMEFAFVTVVGLLVSPWVALTVLVREREAFAREQAIAFRLAQSEAERREQDARLHLMQAQVAPHFLFNTLANVQALVECGSPRAPELLRALITYLRSALPRQGNGAHSLGDELASVRAYLELMRMRMPDRLEFAVAAAPGTEHLACPPLAVLTLVENAVQHGIDPLESGGRIDVACELVGETCLIRVTDTGAGSSAVSGNGTGLATLRQRLALAFGPDAALRVRPGSERGFSAEIAIAARRIAA